MTLATMFVGVGDGKLKRLIITDEGSWNLTHEAQLDSKVVSSCLSPDGNELLVGTHEGKIYRVLTADLSFLLHTDSHSGAINDVHFDKDRSDMFLAIDDMGFLKLWDLSTYKSVLTCSSGRQGLKGTSCCIAEDDKSLVTGWNDGFVRCFDNQ